jgi:hypothetical protein
MIFFMAIAHYTIKVNPLASALATPERDQEGVKDIVSRLKDFTTTSQLTIHDFSTSI